MPESTSPIGEEPFEDLAERENIFDVLTKREREVAGWIVEGKSNADIAIILGISGRTVEKHCESIYRKLGFENRVSLMLWATRKRGFEQ